MSVEDDNTSPVTEREIDSEDRNFYGTLRKMSGRATVRVREIFTQVSGGSSGRTSQPERDSGCEDIEASDKLAAAQEKVMAMERMEKHLDELMQMEEKYVNDLEKIVSFFDDVTKDVDKMPTGLREGDRYTIVFGNIRNLHNFHKNIFSKGLREAINDPAAIEKLFVKRKDDIKIWYSKYNINKPRSEIVARQFMEYFESLQSERKYANIEFRLDSALIRPIQHVTRFPLLFSELVADCEVAGQQDMKQHFLVCHQISKDISQTAEHMMDAGRIQNFEGSINNQGVLLKRGDVKCKASVKKKKFPEFLSKKDTASFFQGHIFMFQQSVVIVEVPPRPPGDKNDTYKFFYKFSINKMELRDVTRGLSSLEFELHSQDKHKQSQFSLTIRTETEQEKKEWIDKIATEIKKLVDLGDVLMNNL